MSLICLYQTQAVLITEALYEVLQVGCVNLPTWFTYEIVTAILGPWHFHMNLFAMSAGKDVRILIGIALIYWLIWSRLTSWYWAFQSRIQLSLYLSLHLSMPSLNFLSTQSCFTVYMSFIGLILNYFIVFDTIVNWKYQFPIVLFYYIETQLVLYIYILSFHFTKFTYWF